MYYIYFIEFSSFQTYYKRYYNVCGLRQANIRYLGIHFISIFQFIQVPKNISYIHYSIFCTLRAFYAIFFLNAWPEILYNETKSNFYSYLRFYF